MLQLLIVVVAAAPKFVIANQLNVRAQARADAKLVYVAGIGEECAPSGEPDAAGWVPVKCGDISGFAKGEFLSAEKPTLAAVRKQFEGLARQEDKAGWDERFAVAQRLLALGEPPKALRQFFIDYLFAQNRFAAEAKGKPLYSLKPKVSDDTEDVVAAASQSISQQLGLGALCIADEPGGSCRIVKESLRGDILPDGTAWFVVAEWDPASEAKFEPYFQYHAIVTPQLAQAFGVEVEADACPMTKAAGLACAGADCVSCMLQCATDCNGTRLGCKLKSKAGAWAKCVEAAAPRYRDCAKRCTAGAP